MELGFLEEFALAEDRDAVLERLIPGTEDYYYYHSLQRQHAGRLREVEPLLAAWRERHGRSERLEEIEARQVLLGWDDDPEAASRALSDRLDLRFDHERRVEGAPTTHPTRLPGSAVDRERFLRRALDQRPNLSTVADRALPSLVERDLDGERRRLLLDRLDRPDVPGLVDLVLADLDHPRSRGFGSLGVHRLLLADQLEELAERRPGLLNDEDFVHLCLSQLRPGPDVPWEDDPGQREAYLERLWAFVEGLAPSFNSLKAHVLHHRLEHDRSRGALDRDRFWAYLRLPRHTPYMAPAYLDRHRDGLVHLGDRRHDAVTGLAPVLGDEPLVRAGLAELLRDEDDYRGLRGPGGGEPLDDLLRDGFLREVFATTKILAGTGDLERWCSVLDDPARYERLRERVDIDLAPENPARLRVADPVVLHADVKNVPVLVLKVFEVNTLNYLLAHGRDVDTGIDFDGLVASVERSYTFDAPPHRRVRRAFELPEVDRPGVFVVELIGNGKSSRALIRKGDLRYLERVGAAGHELTVLDEEGRALTEATAWLGGREYPPDGEGRIRIPFTARPGRTPLLLRHGELTVLEHLDHQAESFAFTAGIHVEREALVAGAEASVLVRPELRVAGAPASLDLVAEPAVVLESTDRHGVAATRTITDLRLSSEREAQVSFRVPEDLAELRVTVRGRVESAVTGEPTELSAARTFRVNRIDGEAATACLHLAWSEGGHVVHLLGKNGEPRAGQVVRLGLRHRDVTYEGRATLQTDARGRVELGELPGIVQLRASAPAQGVEETWRLRGDACERPAALHGVVGERLRLPYAGGAAGIRDAVSLLERRNGTYLRDLRSALAFEDGCLVIDGLPGGDYELRLHDEGARIDVRVAPGRREGSWVVGERRLLETRDRAPLAIAAAEVDADGLRVRLAHASRQARVHVVAARFLAPWTAAEGLARAGRAEPARVEVAPARSHYVSGRDLGDEHRYVLERRYAERYPGNLLTRPGLLLNPWAVEETETDLQEAGAGDAYAKEGARAPRAKAAARPARAGRERPAGGFPTLDFLARPAVVRADLRPDAEGWVRVPRDELGDGGFVTALAVDPRGSVSRTLPLAEAEPTPRDRRLASGLDPEGAYAQRKRVSCLRAGEELVLKDITTSELEAYGDLGRVHGLLATLSGDPDLETFRFVTRWHRLDEAEKRRLYGDHACHELHLFLARKDPEFFARVVRPYLRNKRDKTFLDRYLLGDDVSAYLRPWAYGRLNVVERILLAERVDGEGDATARHVGDRYDTRPPDPEGEDHSFRTALGGGALETEDALGLAQAADAARARLSVQPMASSALPAAAAPPPPRRAGASPAAKDSQPDATLAALEDSEELEALDEATERDLTAREEVRRLYRGPDRTRELAEQSYWRRRTHEVGPDLVEVNAFWRDLARHDGRGPFLSPHVAEACGGFTEAMCALAVLDVPFAAEEPEASYEGRSMRLQARAEAVVFHEEIEPAEAADGAAPVLVSQVYLRDDDRTRTVRGEEEERYVEGELLTHVVYACKVVLTNPTASRRKLDLLLQVPRGALPVRGGRATRSLRVRLAPYETRDLEYAFYFPAPGRFPHLPVQASREGEHLARAPARTLDVVARPTEVDAESWGYVSQEAEPEAVLDYLARHNVEELDLSRIAWRMRDRGFYERALDLLARRHRYDDTLWSYALHHGDAERARDYLLHQERLVRRLRPAFRSTLLTVDPVERGGYEHLEYAPLIHARAHRLGARRRILNDRLAAQYERLLEVLARQPSLGSRDHLAVAYYLFLQDRVGEGLAALDRVDPEGVATRLQLDYVRCYAAFSAGRPEEAREVARRHAEHPVPRWAGLFGSVLAQLDEAEGAAGRAPDARDQVQRQQERAAAEPALELEVSGRTITLRHRHLTTCRLNYYRMDVELLFSRQPFVQEETERFSFIRPNRSDVVDLPAGRDAVPLELPEELRGENVVVEATGGGIRRSQACTASTLRTDLVETMGEVRVRDEATGRPLPRVYVKAYARAGGDVRFFKDGYTDLRGRFDYASLSTDELDAVERFALLVLSDEHGAVVREAAPPRR